MAGVNKVILLGHVGQDPEVTTLQSGNKVAKFSLATSESYKDKSGNKVDNTEWHRIEMWEKLADIAENYVKKGSTIYVEGKIKTEKYTDKDAVERTIVKIRATSLTLLSGNKQENTASNAPAATKPSPSAADLPSVSEGDSDLPF